MSDQGSAETLGRTIRALRLAQRGMTQADLADLIGGSMTQADVSNLELGKVALPRRPRLERIADIFGVSLGELLARSGWNDADRYVADAEEPADNPAVEALIAKLRRTPLPPDVVRAIDTIVDRMAPFGQEGTAITSPPAASRRRRATAAGA